MAPKKTQTYTEEFRREVVKRSEEDPVKRSGDWYV